MLSNIGAALRAGYRVRYWVWVVGLACVQTPATAQEPVTIKFAHRFSSKHYLWTDAGVQFTEQVRRRSAGQVIFDVYPAGQLGKDHFSLLRAGLADMAIFIPSYESEKLPLSSVAELPSMYQTACEGTRRYWQLAQPGGVIGQAEYQRHGLRVLFVAAMPPYTLLTSRKAITRLEDVKGMKIRSTGASMLKTAKLLGAVPVQIPSSETYEALSRGTIDGAILLHYGVPSNHLEDLTRHSVEGINLGGGVIAYAISEQRWAGLPRTLQDIMTQAAMDTQETFCRTLDEQNLKTRDSMIKFHGHQVSRLSPEEVERWNSRLVTVVDDWSHDMDSVGQDGRAMLNDYHATAHPSTVQSPAAAQVEDRP